MASKLKSQGKGIILKIVGCVISRKGGGAGYCVRVNGNDCAAHLAQLKLILHITICCYRRREPVFNPAEIARRNNNDVDSVKRSMVRKLGREFDRVSGGRWFQPACDGDRLLGIELDQIELDRRLLTHPREIVRELAAEAFRGTALWKARRDTD